MKDSDRVSSLDGMRGLAALAVLAFHFVGVSGAVPPGALKSLASHGWLGVPVFFVISGFVIPYSLERAGYRLSDYGVFICKRVARLDPPYLASIFLILAWCRYDAGPGFECTSPSADPLGLLLHLGYLNAFFGHRWINPVYWTLAIEFQYYVAVGLLYPLLVRRRRAPRLALMCLLCSLVFLVPGDQFIFKHLPHFFVGVALFQRRAGVTGRGEFVATLAALFAFSALTLGFPAAAAGPAAALCLRFAGLRQRLLVFAGDISYSLYLLHLPVGGAALLVSQSFGLSWQAGVFAAAAASILAAWLMHLLIERPSQKLSSRIKYRRDAQPAPFPANATEAA